MAGPVLALIPWATLIQMAPAIVDNTTKLIKAVRGTQERLPVQSDVVDEAKGALDVDGVAGAIRQIEGSLVDLNGQMADASLLLNELAESNRLLAETARAQRGLIRLLGVISVGSLVLAVYAVAG
jgi:hypothetical protein